MIGDSQIDILLDRQEWLQKVQFLKGIIIKR